MFAPVKGSPPPPIRGRMDVIRCTTSKRQEFVVISKTPYGQYVHWFGRRSHECKREHSACEGCSDNWPRRWKCYLHVLLPDLRTEAFLEITQEAFERLSALLPESSDWRGLHIRLCRTDGGPRGRYIVEVLERREDPSRLPLEKDPLPLLRHLWRATKGACPS